MGEPVDVRMSAGMIVSFDDDSRFALTWCDGCQWLHVFSDELANERTCALVASPPVIPSPDPDDDECPYCDEATGDILGICRVCLNEGCVDCIPGNLCPNEECQRVPKLEAVAAAAREYLEVVKARRVASSDAADARAKLRAALKELEARDDG